MINLKEYTVWVFGANGLIGRPLCNQLRLMGVNTYPINHNECDLLEYSNLFKIQSWYGTPNLVFNLAGYNGGIQLNQTKGADIFGRTLRMALNVFEFCNNYGVKKVVTPLTSCGYPAYDIPLTENMYLEDKPHNSVRAHGYCRRSMLIYGQLLNKQYGNKFVFPILNNCFGPFARHNEPDRLKVCDSLIAKFVDAEYHNESFITLWGDGSPKRELLYSEDAARGLIKIMEEYEDYENPINLGWGEDHSIKEIANIIKGKTRGEKGQILWDISKSNGAARKILDVSRMKKELNWMPTVTLEQGIEETIKWYKNLRGY